MPHRILRRSRLPFIAAAAVVALSSCVRPAATGGTVVDRRADTVVRREVTSSRATDTVVKVAVVPSSDRDAVMRTVMRLFDGMRAGDSAMVRSAFDSNPRLVTTMVRDGVPVLTTGSVDDFIRAVGTPHPEVWDERISGEVVHIDGPLAAVWMRYSFYAGSRFSHCGVNAIELFRRPDGWRITSIADTRRRERCDESGE